MRTGESIYDRLIKAFGADKPKQKIFQSAPEELEQTVTLIRACKTIFYFGDSYAEARSMVAACNQELHPDMFFLPRDPCAVEDVDSLVLIGDLGAPLGLSHERHAIAAFNVMAEQGSASSNRLRGYIGEMLVVFYGRFHCVQSEMFGHVLACIEMPYHGTVAALSPRSHFNQPSRDDSMFGKRMMRTVSEIIAINSPANIVVQHTIPSAKLRDGRVVTLRGDRVPHGSKPTTRVRYLVLPKRKAHVLVTGTSERESVERCPHLRRRHLRHLGSERFTHKRGETVIVRESWVGDQERRMDDGTVYRVVLDLGHERWGAHPTSAPAAD